MAWPKGWRGSLGVPEVEEVGASDPLMEQTFHLVRRMVPNVSVSYWETSYLLESSSNSCQQSNAIGIRVEVCSLKRGQGQGTFSPLIMERVAWCRQAGLSLSMCAVAWLRKAVPEKTKAAILGICTTLITSFACLTVFVVTETALDIRQVRTSWVTVVSW